jgi:hypothetical protein
MAHTREKSSETTICAIRRSAAQYSNGRLAVRECLAHDCVHLSTVRASRDPFHY